MSRSRYPSKSKPLKVLYDGMIFHRQLTGGINRYFEKLIDHLPDNVEPAITLSKSRENNFPKNHNLQVYVKNFDLPRPLRKVSRAIRATRCNALRRSIAPDLIHATYYDTLGKCEKISNGPPIVVTVHDMIHEKFPRLLDRHGKHAAIKKRAIERADAIICVSQRTRSDLLERFPQCESRTRVIYHATELGQISPENWNSASERPYILYVGSRAGYKNFDGLLNAFAFVAERNRDIQLRTVGTAFSKAEQDRIGSLNLGSRIQNCGQVDDHRLARLYRNSVCLVYPSLYEGFGLPPLEAMSCDTPVVAANTSCIPEVVQEAALLFDPHSTDSMADALNCVIENDALRESLIAKGRQRCQAFSWSRAAGQTFEVYRTALAASRVKTANRLAAIHVDKVNARSRQLYGLLPTFCKRRGATVAAIR